MDTNVDIRHNVTGAALIDDQGFMLGLNIDQADAWPVLTKERYDAGYRIVTHGRTLVDASVAKGGEDISKQAVERINRTTMELRAIDPAFLPSSTVRPFGTQIIDNDGRQAGLGMHTGVHVASNVIKRAVLTSSHAGKGFGRRPR